MKIASSNEFGKAIRDRRKEKGYTQNFLSDYTGISASYISNLENGKETSEIGKALYLANLLGLDIEITSRDK